MGASRYRSFEFWLFIGSPSSTALNYECPQYFCQPTVLCATSLPSTRAWLMRVALQASRSGCRRTAAARIGTFAE